MEGRGKIKQIAIDWLTKKVLLTVELAGVTEESLQKVAGEDDLKITMDKYREKRSKDANAYFHVLAGKIADSQTPPMSKQRCKNMLIGSYGQPEYIDGQPVMIKTQLPVERMLEQEYLHCVPCGCNTEDNGTQTYYYWVYRGSHTYDSKEMSILIDGTVQEAKALGIDTATPDEIARLKALWGSTHG